jgi:hypothetical protein
MQQEIETILSVSRCPRWPRQVQWWLSYVAVIDIITGVIALNYANVNTALDMTMDKLGLTGQNLARVFNSRRGCFHIMKFFYHEAKLSILKLKTRTKQVLGLLLLYIVLWHWPKFWRMFFGQSIKALSIFRLSVENFMTCEYCAFSANAWRFFSLYHWR